MGGGCVYNNVMRWLLPICCALLVTAAGCLRDVPDTGDVPATATATHPWELPGYELPPELERTSAETETNTTEQPVMRGPKLPGTDTLDPELLLGRWLQVCFVKEEKMNQSVVGSMNILEIQPGGMSRYLDIRDNEATPLDGTWSKLAPGVLGLGFGEDRQQLEMYGELFAGQFLYLWSYDTQQGLWFARMPDAAAPRIEANLFEHTRGELHLTDVVAQSYRGVLSGESEITVGGYYESGVMTMAWEDQAGNLGGFAAYIVSPDWETLDGVWWIDDWEAAPFGGRWQATRK